MTNEFDREEPETVRVAACTVQSHAAMLADPARLRREGVYVGLQKDPVEPFHMWNCPRCLTTLGSFHGPIGLVT